MERHQTYRRGLSGIWSGVLVILILLLTSSFIFVSLDYIDKATTTALNTVKRSGESCSIIRSITGYWSYDDTTGTLSINLTNYYLESITIVSLGLVVNNTGTIQHVIIDRYNASSYGITLPTSVPPGGNVEITVSLSGKPVIVSVGIWGSGLATLVIPGGKGVEAVGAIQLPESIPYNITINLIQNNTIFYTDMSTKPPNWTIINGRWRIIRDAGYWGTGDNALRAKLTPGRPLAVYAWDTDLSTYTSFQFYTKINFDKVDPNNIATVRLNGTYIVFYFWPPFIFIFIEPYYYNINVTSNSLVLEFQYRDIFGTWHSSNISEPITVVENKWYSLLISYKRNTSLEEVLVQLYDSTTGTLVSSISGYVSFPTFIHALVNASLIGFLNDGGISFNLFFDEILVSTGDTSKVTFNGTEAGWRISILYNSTLIGESTASGASTDVGVVKDAVTAIDGYSIICVDIGSYSACANTDIPILGGNVYEISVIGGGAGQGNIVGISSSSR